MLEDYRLSRVDGQTRLDWIVAAYPTAIGRVLTPATRAVFRVMACGNHALARQASRHVPAW